ncbi:hypothetical protein [Frigidibacter oleivorans]|uniref:hypothetical protein n=1 Tax=Frigidibacter oleivorans TaxID=2487129 RepID=UPI000F8DAD00|nr:hypothetical protein [Frigidibacter oleivorans]
MPRHIAILTGDLIASTAAPSAALAATMQRLAEAADEIARWGGAASAATRFTRFRGDGWQICTAPAQSLRAAVYLHACLRARRDLLATRIAIGLGPVDTLGSADLSDARGAALVASGHALDGMRRSRVLAIAGPGIDARDRIILQLIEDILRRWTRPQAEAAALMLTIPAPTLDEAGRRLGITPQAVNDRLTKGGVQSLRDALAMWEEDREAQQP